MAGAAAFSAASLVAVVPSGGGAFVVAPPATVGAPSSSDVTAGLLRGTADATQGMRRSSATRRGAPCTAAGAVGLASGAALAVVASKARRSAGRGRAQQLRVATVDAPTAVEKKKDLTGMLPDCPATIWNADNIDLDNLPEVKETAPLVVDALEIKEGIPSGQEKAYFAQQRESIMEQLQEHGAIVFRNFEMMKDAEGFREFYESLQLNPCLDPIHTSGLREMVGKKDAVYEAVNKPSLAQHFVGLHNESTYVKTAMYGAFVCFKPASEGGGEFLIADGAKIINDMDKEVLRRLYESKIRISVSNLDLNFIDAIPVDGLKQSVKDGLQDLILKAVAPKFEMDLEMIYGADGSNPLRLQAVEHAQSPINTHPVTGQPVWFCNMHNHSRYLRDRRPCTVPEVGMTDVYKGDLGQIPPEDVEHVNEVCERNMVSVTMQKGDVVLLDNYRVLHGRKTFKGERNHAVTWFESCGEPLSRDNTQKDKPDDFMNNLINKTLV